MSDLVIVDGPAILAAGERVGIDRDVLSAVRAMLERIAGDADLARATAELAQRLAHDAPGEAIASLRALALHDRLGADAARTYHLALALAQVPAAEARHAARGIDPAITRATMSDLAVWARHFRKQIGARGITLEILDWSQRYLRGELLRIGSLQLEPMPFAAPVRVLRDRATRALRAISLEHQGRAIDLATGEVSGERASEPAPSEEIALEPGVMVLDMHVPADSFLSLRRIGRSLHDGMALFARLSPDLRPAGVAGEAWILDPQVRALLPRNAGLHALQQACSLYPSKLPEQKTIRRLFGPDVERAALAALPREGMTSLQLAVLDLLASPGASLRARGGFLLREELERMEVYRP